MGFPASRQVGFSLVEVTVVVALIGMLALVGLPTMHDWLERYRVRTAAQEIASAIQLQRMRAVSQNQNFSVDFDVTQNTWALYQGLPSSGTMLDPQPHTLPSGVTFIGSSDPVDVPNDEFICHSDGSMNDSTAVTDRVYVGNASGDVFRVSVNRSTGRVDVEHHAYAY